MRSIIAAVAVIASASGAYCQTAEETVQYLLFGYDGLEQTRIDDNNRFTIAPDPQKKGGLVIKSYIDYGDVQFDGMLYSASITKQADCIFSIDGDVLDTTAFATAKVKNYIRFHIDADFTKAVDVKLSSQPLPTTETSGVMYTCTPQDADYCQRVETEAFINFGTRERLAKAWTYFKDTYCKGSAF